MNRIVHFEINSPDPEKAEAFYKKVFDWSFRKWEGPENYWLITTGEEGTPGIDGGMMKSRDGQPGTVNTIAVESVDDYAKSVEENGGQVVVPKMAIQGVGYVAYCTDPGGVLFGIYRHDESAA